MRAIWCAGEAALGAARPVVMGLLTTCVVVLGSLTVPTAAAAAAPPAKPGAAAEAPPKGEAPAVEAAPAAEAAEVEAKAEPPAKPQKPIKRVVPDDPTKVYLFLDPVSVEAPAGERGDDLGAVLTRLARARLNALASVRLKTYLEMPEVPEVMARFGDLEQLDRVSLIAIKNLTGFDGLVRIAYRYEDDQVALVMTAFDFRNGQIFRKRELTGPMGASLFQVVEADLTEFATTVRRSYRVTLDVNAMPRECRVLVNGQLVGKTPLTHELKSGEYRVRVEKEGFKEYEKTFRLSDGDKLDLDVTLYNPLAARFLNAPPGFRVDSRELNLGYRYVYLGLDRPGVDAAHFFVASWLMRFLDWDVGVSWATSAGMEGENRLDTFLGDDEGLQRYELNLNQFLIVAKYALFEKYSFASVRLGATSGLTLAGSDDGDQDLSQWSYSGSVFVELVSRLFRAGNFSLEAQIDLGLSYLGLLPYTERTFSLFGTGPAEEKDAAMIGPMGGITLRLVFWNDIF